MLGSTLLLQACLLSTTYCMHFATFVTVKLFFKTQEKANLTVACQRGAKGTRVVEVLDVWHINQVAKSKIACTLHTLSQ